jgi:hypothetical protein
MYKAAVLKYTSTYTWKVVTSVPQLSLYLDSETMTLMQRNAEMEQRSMSAYVANLIREKVSNRWPTDYWSLYGSVTDDSLRRPDQPDSSLDAKRETL